MADKAVNNGIALHAWVSDWHSKCLINYPQTWLSPILYSKQEEKWQLYAA